MSSPIDPVSPTSPGDGVVGEELSIGAPKARRGTTMAVALITGGAVAGGILASTLGASAASSNSSSTTPAGVTAAVSSSAPAPSSEASGTKKARPNFVAPLTGKVTAVGTDSVTIQTTATSTTASTTTTYSVTSTTRISINETGPGALTGVKVGDTVFFNTTTTGGTVLADLRDGTGPAGGGPGRGGFGGGPGGGGFGGFGGQFGRELTGTVTAVGSGTITVKTGTATTTYSVTSTSVLDKAPAAPTTPPAAGTKPTPVKPTVIILADIKVGDTVFFGTTTKDGTVISHLIDGKLSTFAFGGRGDGGFGGGMRGGDGGQGQAQPNATTAPATDTTTGVTT